MSLLLHQLKHAHAAHHGYCSVCDKSVSQLYQCGDCNVGVYCGKQCQQADLKSHQGFCLVAGNGAKRKRDIKAFDEWAEQVESQKAKVDDDENQNVVTFGMLPPDIIQLIVQFLPKKDVGNLRLVSQWLANHPAIIYNLQHNYTWGITSLQQLMPVNLVDWTRKIQKITILLGGIEAQNVVNLLPIYFDHNTLRIIEIFSRFDNLTPLSHFSQLHTLKLFNYTGDNISALSNLTQLHELLLSEYTGDISVLAKLTQLYALLLWDYTGDISVLAKLPQLHTLHLVNYTGDISVLAKLTQLHTLHLDNYIGDISVLAKLTQLHTLHLVNYTGDISVLAKLTQLRELMLDEYMEDISVLVKLPQLHILYLDNYIGDILVLAKLTQLHTLHLDYYTGDISVLAKLTQLRELILNEYMGDISVLAKLTQLHILYLVNYTGDISALANLTQLQILRLSSYHPHYENWKEYLASLRAN